MRNGAKARFPPRKAVPIHLECAFVNKFRLSLMAAAAIGIALSAQVFAQGYNGLMPDNKPSQSTSKGDDTFGGIVSPAPGTKQPDEPAGYTGLIPGKTDKAAEAAPDPYDEDRKLRDKPASKVKYKKVENPFAPKKLQSNNKVILDPGRHIHGRYVNQPLYAFVQARKCAEAHNGGYNRRNNIPGVMVAHQGFPRIGVQTLQAQGHT